jgi:hypothetical protein
VDSLESISVKKGDKGKKFQKSCSETAYLLLFVSLGRSQSLRFNFRQLQLVENGIANVTRL